MNRLLKIVLAILLFSTGFKIAQVNARRVGSLPLLQNYISNTLDLTKFRRYEAFNPRETYKKYGFISSSYYAQTGIYNQPDGQLIRHQDGYIGRIANFILQKEYDTDVRFYDVGRSSSLALDHLWYLANFVTAPNAYGVIYTNGYTSLDIPRSRPQDVNVPYVNYETLQYIKKHYPDLKAEVTILEGFLASYASVDLSQSASKVDPVNLLYYDCDDEYPTMSFRTSDCDPMDDMAHIRDNLSSKLLQIFDPVQDKKKSVSELPGLYDAAVTEYGRAEHDLSNILNVALIFPEQEIAKKQAEDAFYDIIVGIAERRNLKFIFYFPPMYELPPNEYWTKLKPFIDHLQDRYKNRQDVYFIDHTFLPEINSFDAYYRKRGQCEGLCKKNHNLGIIGNVKRIRALFSALEELTLLDAPASSVGVAFKAEPTLPHLDMCLNIVGMKIDAKCAYTGSDYLQGSKASQLSLGELYPNAKVENKYIRETFYSGQDVK